MIKTTIQKPLFHMASPEDIKSGRVSDVYFLRTKKILDAYKINSHVVMEIRLKNFPAGYNWGILAGVEEALKLLEDLPVDAWCLPEGSLFFKEEPVFSVSGRYRDFGHFETSLLGFLCQASGIATKAAHLRLIAGFDKSLVSFGARRMHPATSPMIERAAYIGGFDGVATLVAGELLHLDPTGTMPHALILLFGDTVKALKAFDRVIEKKIKRAALIDTLGDEKFEAIRAAEALKGKLFAVRLDTPASRRGDFKEIIREVRWELNLRGFHDVKIFVSGGLDEAQVRELKDEVDAFGIGTSLSNAPTLDFAMDIVEIDSKAMAKRGKLSGQKQIFECPKCGLRKIFPKTKTDSNISCLECKASKMKPKLELVMTRGKVIQILPSVQEIKNRVIERIRKILA